MEYRRLDNLLGKMNLNEQVKNQLYEIINPLRINKNKNSKKQKDHSLNWEQFSLFLIIRHMFGADNDQFAIDIAKLSLWIQILKESFSNSKKKELTQY